MASATIVFCSDPLNERAPDSVYEDEVNAAERAGFEHVLVSYEALVFEQNPARAVRRVERQDASPMLGIYRGWMLTPPQYALLYGALERKGIRLINDPISLQS